MVGFNRWVVLCAFLLRDHWTEGHRQCCEYRHQVLGILGGQCLIDHQRLRKQHLCCLILVKPWSIVRVG